MRLGVAIGAFTFLMPFTLGGSFGCVRDVPGEVELGEYYLYNDLCQPGCAFSTWVFQETNGIPGLQTDIFSSKGACYPSWIDPDAIVL